MSKYTLGVGDDFPLDDDGARERGRHDDWRDRHAFQHRRWHRHGRGRHRPHFGPWHVFRGLGLLAVLLVGAGLATLVMNHQLTAPMALGLVGAGAGLLLLRALVSGLWFWRLYRRASERMVS